MGLVGVAAVPREHQPREEAVEEGDQRGQEGHLREAGRAPERNLGLDAEALADVVVGDVGRLEDDAGEVTGDIRDTVLYRVRLEDGTEIDVRWRNLRPP